MPVADHTTPPPPGLLSANIRGLGVGLASGMAYSAAKFSALKIISSSNSSYPPTLVQIQETQSQVRRFQSFSPLGPQYLPAVQSYCSEDHIPRTNGVLTLLHRSALDPQSTILVPGRATSTSFSLNNLKYHSINIYSPSNPSPADSPELIIGMVRQFLARVRRLSPQSHIIISGDFNTDMSNPSRTQILYHTLFYEFELLDALMLISGNDSPTWRGPGLRAHKSHE